MAADPCVPFQGVRVWVPDRDRVWVGGEVVSVEGDEGGVVVRCEGEEETKLLGTKDSLPLLRNPQMLVGANDLTTLSYLHEPAGIPSPFSLFPPSLPTRYHPLFTKFVQLAENTLVSTG